MNYGQDWAQTVALAGGKGTEQSALFDGWEELVKKRETI